MKRIKLENIEDFRKVYHDTYSILKIKEYRQSDEYAGFTNHILCGFSEEDNCPLADTHTISFNYGRLKQVLENNDYVIKYEPLGKIDNKDLFWEAFDSYLTNHRDEILDSIARYFLDTIDAQKKTIHTQIENLKSFLKNVESDRKEIMKEHESDIQ